MRAGFSIILQAESALLEANSARNWPLLPVQEPLISFFGSSGIEAQTAADPHGSGIRATGPRRV